MVLIGLRDTLRRHNLYDVGTGDAAATTDRAAPARRLVARTADGTHNDLRHPRMGSAGTRFGRNVPLAETVPGDDEELVRPNPRTVSRELLTRRSFVPATTLNVLAAAWIQFEIRDWFRHGEPPAESPWRLPLADGDPWPERPMLVRRTHMDPDVPGGPAPTFTNFETHWWDASQLYGSDAVFQRMLRSGVDGKLTLGEDGSLPFDPAASTELPGGAEGWWLGLAALHTLFMREHNAVCDRLKAEYSSWSDDDLFDHARLVVAALMAKIHTVEWTPAILGHPALQIAMRANWWGLATERVHRLLGRLGDGDVLSGIPGSTTDHHGVPYAITEEFVAVYRMHPLIPDDYELRSAADDHLLAERPFRELAGARTKAVLDATAMTDVLYSLGIAHPGAMTLRNYPRALQELETADGRILDLATIDLLRTRERGVPRYNAFRRLLHLAPVGSFEELAGDPELAAQMRRIYEDDIERVDLLVGMLAERPPEGFGFSDTAFRIFVLMASRRLKSDRFFTTDFSATVYTQTGLDWIRDNDMRSVLLRHYPGLAPALRGVRNAFAPWVRLDPTREAAA
jgi:hypothetical protein